MIARAKTSKGEIVEGYYLETNKAILGSIMSGSAIYVHAHFIKNIENEEFNINPETVEYKIVDEWYSMEELTDIVLNGSW